MAFALEDFEKQEPSNPAAGHRRRGSKRKARGDNGKPRTHSWQLASDESWEATRQARIVHTAIGLGPLMRKSVSARNFNGPFRSLEHGFSW